MSAPNELAKRLKALHQPGTPLVLGNVWDGASAAAVASVPGVKALATASYAVAATFGLADNDMSQAQNLEGIARVARVAAKHDLPLTADLQDGYADVADTIRKAVRTGVVGCNLEDDNCEAAALRPLPEAVARIKTALKAAADEGVPDFALNARTDVLGYGGSVQDAIERGRAYLEAGATTVFVWGPGGRGVSRAEVAELVKGLDGRLNVSMKLLPDFLTRHELAEIGVARISVGPGLQSAALAGLKNAAEAMYA